MIVKEFTNREAYAATWNLVERNKMRCGYLDEKALLQDLSYSPAIFVPAGGSGAGVCTSAN
jgi:hypothetical protein